MSIFIQRLCIHLKHSSLYSTDAEFLLHLQQGDKKAFELLYDRHYISVFVFARRFVTDQQAAEDISTEIFLKLWDRLTDFDSLPAIRSFLYISTRNACLNHIRSLHRRSTQQEQWEYLLKQYPDEVLPELQLQADVYQHIYEEIEKLSPQLKLVFRMAYIDGLSNDEIAEQLGINNQSVRNDKSRALKQLRLAMMDKNIYGFFLLWLALRQHLHS